jgi:hypothetical protein
VFEGIVCDGAHGLGGAYVGFVGNEIAAHSSVVDSGLEASYCSDSEGDIVQFDFAAMRRKDISICCNSASRLAG